MTRLRRLAVLTVLLFARPAAARPTAPEIVQAAQAQVVACAKVPGLPAGACRDALQILSGYLAELKSAEQCLAKPCPVGFIERIFDADRKLDEAEHALPDAARADATGRPLLRLSLLVSQRAAAALAAADPSAKVPFRFDPPVDAPRAVETACLDVPASCADARAALAGALDLSRRIAECEGTPCAFEKLDAAAMTAENAMGAYERARDTKADMLTIFSLINGGETRLALTLLKDAADRLARLQGGLGPLQKGLDGLEQGAPGADAAGLEAQVGALTGLFREASLTQDRANAFMITNAKADGPRVQLNEAAARLAASRSRLLALETARGLGTPSGAGGVFAGAAGGRAPLAAQVPAGTAPTFLDRRTIPAPVTVNGKAPPILTNAPGALELLKNLNSDDPVKRADARRRAGLSSTVGDPSGRAALVHGQQYGDTCAVVSQQEVLIALHLLPTGDPNKQETQLREEARARGFYRQGTPDHYTADILVDRGVLVEKRQGAPLSDLDAAVRRGGLVIANVDARYLWNRDAPVVWGHAVVITGAEVDRWSGKTVGYYINDSGSDPPGHGRFVPVESFQKAWDHHTRSYAEVK